MPEVPEWQKSGMYSLLSTAEAESIFRRRLLCLGSVPLAYSAYKAGGIDLDDPRIAVTYDTTTKVSMLRLNIALSKELTTDVIRYCIVLSATNHTTWRMHRPILFHKLCIATSRQFPMYVAYQGYSGSRGLILRRISHSNAWFVRGTSFINDECTINVIDKALSLY